MFHNECLIPERAILDFLLKIRLNKFHPRRSEIEEDYKNRMAGYRGEKSLDYYLAKLSEPEYDIIHSLRLPNKDGTFFQMDKLLIKNSHLLNLEAKNRAGRIHFDKKLDQVYCTLSDSNEMKRIQNPIIQAKEQAAQLHRWLSNNGFGNLPIEYLYVNANPKTIITVDNGHEHLLQRACNSEILLEKILQTNHTHNKKLLNDSTRKKLAAALLAAHTPPQYDIHKLYGISTNDILAGVHCPRCFAIPMKYENGVWQCLTCNFLSRTAFADTIYTFFLLIKPTITNLEARNFLQIPSPDIIFDLLKLLDLPYTGSKKGRVYHIPENIYFLMNKIINAVEN